MTTTVANSKRSRTGRADQLNAPYDVFTQPKLYKQLYPNVSGADRTFAIPILFRSKESLFANFENMAVETEKWPKTFDGETHKAAYTVTQFMISTDSVADPVFQTVPNNSYFERGSMARPYALAVQMSSANTHLTSCKAMLAATPTTEECHVILAFPAPFESYNPWYQRTPPSAAGNTSTPHSPNFNGEAPQATWIGAYPPPGIMRFALPYLYDMTQFQEWNGPAQVTFIKLVVTLLD